jgi:hypothetical protein
MYSAGLDVRHAKLALEYLGSEDMISHTRTWWQSLSGFVRCWREGSPLFMEETLWYSVRRYPSSDSRIRNWQRTVRRLAKIGVTEPVCANSTSVEWLDMNSTVFRGHVPGVVGLPNITWHSLARDGGGEIQRNMSRSIQIELMEDMEYLLQG